MEEPKQRLDEPEPNVQTAVDEERQLEDAELGRKPDEIHKLKANVASWRNGREPTISQTENKEADELEMKLKERDSILDVVQRFCLVLDTRVTNQASVLMEKDRDHLDAMTKHKSSLAIMKEQVNADTMKAYQVAIAKKNLRRHYANLTILGPVL